MAGIPESLVRFVQALVEDEGLHEWFESLAMFSPRERAPSSPVTPRPHVSR